VFGYIDLSCNKIGDHTGDPTHFCGFLLAILSWSTFFIANQSLSLKETLIESLDLEVHSNVLSLFQIFIIYKPSHTVPVCSLWEHFIFSPHYSFQCDILVPCQCVDCKNASFSHYALLLGCEPICKSVGSCLLFFLMPKLVCSPGNNFFYKCLTDFKSCGWLVFGDQKLFFIIFSHFLLLGLLLTRV